MAVAAMAGKAVAQEDRGAAAVGNRRSAWAVHRGERDRAAVHNPWADSLAVQVVTCFSCPDG